LRASKRESTLRQPLRRHIDYAALRHYAITLMSFIAIIDFIIFDIRRFSLIAHYAIIS